MYLCEKIFTDLKRISALTDADPTTNSSVTCAIVQLCGDQIALHATLAIVMAGLQKQGRFARVHC